MSEIFNLGTLCRCCHADGNFKSLRQPCESENGREIYESMLQEVFGIAIYQLKTPTFEASYTICDQCINILRDADSFRKQVLDCEKKFHVYCKNEDSFATEVILKSEPIDTQQTYDDNYCNNDYVAHTEVEEKVNWNFKKEELKIEVELPPVEVCQDMPNIAQHKVDLKKFKIKKENKPKICSKIKIKKDTKSRILSNTIKKRTKIIAPSNQRKSPHHLIKITKKDKKYNNYICVKCAEEFNTLFLITQHLYKTHKGSISYVCEPCERPFLNHNTYKQHLIKHKNDCKVCCGKEYYDRLSFLEHTKTHNINSKYLCDICKKVYKNRSTLKKHMKWHQDGVKRVLCELCGRGFNDKTNLNIHITTVHEGRRPYICDACGRGFTSKKYLRNHIIVHHMFGLYKCDTCEKPFKCQKSLQIHKLKHDNIYFCQKCNVSYYDRESYKTHTHITKSAVISHECELCNKPFSTSYSLKRHKNSHNGIRNFPCDKCTLSFMHTGQLKRHVARVHDPNKKYIERVQCLTCKRCVKDIDRHMKSHESAKFTCSHCGSAYVTNKSLLRHLRHMHLAKVFNCDICHKSFVSLKSVINHKGREHKDLKESSKGEGIAGKMENPEY